MQKIASSKTIDFYSAETSTEMLIPIMGDTVSAGFPSPAEDYIEQAIDLNRELIKNPSSTFFGRVKGLSMKDAGITTGDILVVDKSLEPFSGRIAVCFLDGEFTLKRIKIEEKVVWLEPENEEFKPIKVTEDNELIIWGIVTYVIKKFA